MSETLSFVKFVTKIVLLYIIVVGEANLTDSRSADSYKSLSQNHGLFNSSDHVVVLNFTNFKSSINGSEHGWLVEFYNSWCGYCQRFAPTWKALANNILTWRDIVTVAAIDCVDDDNNQICRDYEIMHYPVVRYFAPHGNLQTLGTDLDKGKDMDSLRQNLITLLQNEQQTGRGSNWPNITPFRSSEIKNLWEQIPSSVKYFFFIFENTDSYLGSEIILDYHNVTSLRIRRVTSDNNMLCMMHKITKFPSLIAFDRNEVESRLNLPLSTREITRRTIKEFMTMKGIDVTIRDVPDEHPGEWQKAEIPPQSNRLPNPIVPEKSESSETITSSDVVHQADLETALRFSIEHEIPTMKLINDDRMIALKNYITALGSYFPMKRGNPKFLNNLSLAVRTKESMTGSNFLELIKTEELKVSPPIYSEKKEWIGCRGSKPTFRGYPCGLWKIFHTLTVNFAIKSEEHSDMEPTQILKAIHGYVQFFFGCYDCAQHFLSMAKKNNMTDVKTADESVLWLWEAHNEVNERLRTDKSTDPEHPKIQYPRASDCRSCRLENGRWNRNEVLKFLKKQYSYDGIHYDGFAVGGSTTRHDDVKPRPAQQRLHLNARNAASRKFGWDFTIFDISICVVLYVTSAAILILVCIKFAVKRSIKKKHHNHNFNGRA